MIAEIFDLVGVDVRGRRLDRRGEVEDDRIVGGGLEDVHHRGAAFDAEIELGGREGFGAVFEAPVGAGLENPRGFAWGSDGTLYVALAGISNTPTAGDATPVALATTGGLDGSVVYIGDNTCAVTYQGVLPSA